MPAISPFLDDLLTRWTQRSEAVRKEIGFQKELLDSASIALVGSRLAIGEQRRQDSRELQTLVSKLRMPHVEHQEMLLQKHPALKTLADQVHDIENTLQTTQWLTNAESHADSFAHRLDLQAQTLQEEHRQFHEKLEEWSAQLQERLGHLQEFKEKETAKGERLYVSHARKQPEIDFVQHHREREQTLRLELQQLRQSLNHSLSRIHKMSWTLTQRTSKNGNGLTGSHQDLNEMLQNLEKVFYERRDEILSDALLFEAGRRHLQTADDVVRSMPCVEDTAAPPNIKSAWAKFLN